MIQVSEIESLVKETIGTSDDVEFYLKLNEAIELLASLGKWDPLIGEMNICANLCQITLPDEVDSIEGIQIGGYPKDIRDKWFEYALNGSGRDFAGLADYVAISEGPFVTIRDLSTASRIGSWSTNALDAGLALRVFGYDANQQWIMSNDASGVLADGFDVPITAFPISAYSTQSVRQIVRVRKPVTRGILTTLAPDDGFSVLGVYRPYEIEPNYRRIRIMGAGCPVGNPCGENVSAQTTLWVHMRYKRKTYKVSSLTDGIPLQSPTAIRFACRAIKQADANILEGPNSYDSWMQAARKALSDKQKATRGANRVSIQFQRTFAAGGLGNMV